MFQARALANAIGVKGAGADVVHGDVFRRQFGRKGFGEPDHPWSNGIREEQAIDGLLDRCADDVDNASTACLAHVGQGESDEAYGAEQIEFKGSLPVRIVEMLEISWRGSTGIIDEDVEVAKLANSCGDDGCCILGFGDIGGNG